MNSTNPTSVEEFLKGFAHPDPKFSPAPLWWWSGEKLDINRLRWQMDQLAAMGIHNVVVINLAPNGTLFGSDPDDPPFLSEPWWKIFEQVCDHAKSIGMFIWFYDQIGFSGASYQAEIATAHPECTGEHLRRLFIEGAGPLQIECPAAATPIAAYVFPLDSPLTVRYLPVDVRKVAVEVEHPSKLCLVYSVRQGYDLFSRPACERLLDAVHREFARRLPNHIGTTLVGSFQDELPDLPTWGPTFAQSFAEKHGYHLETVIHRLFEQGDADARRARLQYHAHRADLAEHAFFRPFFQWHEEHHLQCGFDQQSPAREARVLGSVTKYADYIQTHRWYAIPGSDLHGNGKLHSSIAFMYGRDRVWIEGFHSTGWGGTLADTFDWLLPYLQSGANFFNPHAVYYSTNKGWWEWAPPSTCWRQPYARHYQTFADTIARLTKLLSVGIHQAAIAVLFPSSTVQSAAGPQDHFPDAAAADQALHEVIGSMRWHQAKLGPLDERPIAFHILDEPTIQNSDVALGPLTIREVPLNTIILPHVTMLQDATLARLVTFAAAGGRIIAIGSDSVETPAGQTMHISTMPNATVIPNAAALPEILKNIPRTIRATVPTLHRRLGDIHVLLVPAVAGMATVVKWPNWSSPIEHSTIVPDRYLKTMEVVLPGKAKTVWRFDPRDGKTSELAPQDGMRLTLDFDGSPFNVLIWRHSDETLVSTPPPLPSTRRNLDLSDRWLCEYVPTLPTEYPDIHDPSQPDLRLPHTADFQWQRDDQQANPEIVRATFSIRAWKMNPGKDPEPISYSPKFGILNDKLHNATLGPKGHVPEEFITLGKLTKAQTVAIRTSVISTSNRPAVLAIGANAFKAAAVNGQSARSETAEYLWTTPITLIQGENLIDLTLTAERDETVRLFWCLLDPDRLASFSRPERISSLEPFPPGETVTYLHKFETQDPITDGKIKISIAAIAGIFIDGQLLGRQGGFDPYRLMMRGQTYSFPHLAPGSHELKIETIQPDRPAPLLVDCQATASTGKELTLMSSAQWTVKSENRAEHPVHIHSRPEDDAAAWLLYRRPHPLPQTNWLEKSPLPSPILDLPPSLPSPEPVPQSLRWIVPPGAISMRLPLAPHNGALLWIDGRGMPIPPSGEVKLPNDSPTLHKSAILRIISRELAGGLLTGPVTYRFATGLLSPGSWRDQGLQSYSGAIRLRQTFHAPPEKHARVFLNLGHIRGSLEAKLNGHPVGIRCIAPYSFDLTPHLRPGSNDLELLITSTLANFLSTWSPTRWWSPDQLEAGIFGPITLWATIPA